MANPKPRTCEHAPWRERLAKLEAENTSLKGEAEKYLAAYEGCVAELADVAKRYSAEQDKNARLVAAARLLLRYAVVRVSPVTGKGWMRCEECARTWSEGQRPNHDGDCDVGNAQQIAAPPPASDKAALRDPAAPPAQPGAPDADCTHCGVSARFHVCPGLRRTTVYSAARRSRL